MTDDIQVTTATHDIFRGLIKYNYEIPHDTYSFSVLYNTALNFGYKIVAVYEDGVVYRVVQYEFKDLYK